jgi:hypothetical protein
VLLDLLELLEYRDSEDRPDSKAYRVPEEQLGLWEIQGTRALPDLRGPEVTLDIADCVDQPELLVHPAWPETLATLDLRVLLDSLASRVRPATQARRVLLEEVGQRDRSV